MNFRHRKHRGGAVLEIAPLVDIVFILLIFFMLTAAYVKNPHLDVNLPQASLNKAAEPNKDLDIGITDTGDIHYGNKTITLDELEGILRREHNANADAIIVIRADKASQHGRVVDVMDLAKRVGFEKLSIAVRAKSGG